jgi:outer membrane receptor protein involved in Fe transport
MISTESYGLEGVFNIRLMDGLSFESNATYEHDEYTQYTSVSACLHCVGNTLQRQPDIMANAGLYYDDGRFDGAFYDTYTGRTYTSDLNNIKLPGYHIFRLNLGYTLPFAGGDKARLGLSVYNLLNSVAATEGSPRQGNAQNVGQAYFIGRDVLPRRVSLQLNYRF